MNKDAEIVRLNGIVAQCHIMLKKVRYVSRDGCPLCSALPGQKCESDCALAALIEETKG